MRLIDADSLKGKEVHGTIGDVSGDFIPAFEIALAPTVEAEPVKHGRWIYQEDEELFGAWVECSVCHIGTLGETRYCSNCGAKMDLEENGNAVD